MRAVVIGYGSIGTRHTQLLNRLGCKVSVVSRRNIDFPSSYKTIKQALQSEEPDYVVIANRTVEHADTLHELIHEGFDGIVLVEKPLFQTITEIPSHRFKGIFVAYNLRFHPLIQEIRELLQDENIISAYVYVGRYLPLWRPDSDYRQSYSADKEAGGGSLRDLSHELDYLTWIFGGWRELTAMGGHYSHLDIKSDDAFSILMTTAKCPLVTINMNYVDRIGQREIIINTDKHTIKADLIGGTLQMDAGISRSSVDYDETYLLQHQAIMNNNHDDLCSIDEGLDIVRFIEAAEEAANSHKWIVKS